MTTLTDRYVWGVLRALPAAQRAELEPEIRALVADAVEARAGDGLAPEAAARDALQELGDPEDLAIRYLDREQYLVGPRLYREWRRLLTLVLPIVVPIAGVAVGGANLLGGASVGEAVVAGLEVAFTVAVQTVFWFTLVFAIVERTGAGGDIAARSWSPDDLPEAPAPERLGIAELVASVSASVIVAVILVWQQAAPPVVIDGEATPLFDPALWSSWLPWFLGVTLAEIAFTVALYVRGRWTWVLASVNAALGAAFAVPAIWLIANGLLLNPSVVAEITAVGGTWLEVTTTVAAIIIAAIAAWDAIDGFRKAWLNTRPERAPAA